MQLKKTPYARIIRNGLKASSLHPFSELCAAIHPWMWVGWGTLLVLWGRASSEWLSVVFGSLFLETWGGEANNIPSELRKNLQWKLSHCLISIVPSSAEIHEKSLSNVPDDTGWQGNKNDKNLDTQEQNHVAVPLSSQKHLSSKELHHSPAYAEPSVHRLLSTWALKQWPQRARQLSQYIMVKTIPTPPDPYLSNKVKF